MNIYNNPHLPNNTNKEDNIVSLKLDDKYEEDYTKYNNYLLDNKAVNTYCDKETDNK